MTRSSFLQPNGQQTNLILLTISFLNLGLTFRSSMLFDTSTWSLWPWGRRDQGHNCVSRVLSLFLPRGKERTLETRSAGTIIFHVRVWDRACWLIARKQIYLIGHKFMCMYVYIYIYIYIFKYLRGKKDATTFSRQDCFVNRFTIGALLSVINRARELIFFQR